MKTFINISGRTLLCFTFMGFLLFHCSDSVSTPEDSESYKIAFRSDRMMLLDSESANTRAMSNLFTGAKSFYYSPDGSHVALIITSGSSTLKGITISDVAGTTREHISDTEGAEDVRWSSDGNLIMFNKRDLRITYSIVDKASKSIVSPPYETIAYNAGEWIPGSHKVILYVSDPFADYGKLMEYDVQSETSRIVLDSIRFATDFSVSEAAGILIFRDSKYTNTARRFTLWKYDLFSEQSEVIVNGGDRQIQSAIISPDGQRVAFLRERDATARNYELFVLDLNSGELQQIGSQRGEQYSVKWRPDSRALTCLGPFYLDGQNLLCFDIHGQNQKVLINQEQFRFYTWLPELSDAF